MASAFRQRLVQTAATVCAAYTLVGAVGYAVQQTSRDDDSLLLNRLLGPLPETHAQFLDDPWRNISSLFLCIMVAAVSPASGVGGGAFFVAVFASIMQWSIPAAVALSQASMAAAALAGSCASALNPHPDDPSRPVVDYSLGLILSPGMLVGSSMGVLLNALLPTWSIAFTLTVLLGFVAYKSASKAVGLIQQEDQKSRQANNHDSSHDQQDGSTEGEGYGAQAPLLSKEQASTFWRNYKGLFGMIAFWIVYNVLEVHKREDDRCDMTFAIVEGLQVSAGIVTLALSVWWVSSEQQASGGTPDEPWDFNSYARVAVYSLLGGILAGAVGIGGGFVIAPVLLSLGVHPAVSASTSTTVLTFSASFSAVAYARMGLLNYQFAAIFAGACLISGAIGVAAITKLVSRLGRPSILVVLMASIATAATILTGISKGGQGIQDLIHGRNVGFKDFCK